MCTMSTLDQMEIFSCVRRGDCDGLQELLDKGLDVNSREDRSGCTALHRAAEYGKEDVVELLLGACADIDARDKHGNTPWDLACRTGLCATVPKKVARSAREVAEMLSPGQPLPRESEVRAKLQRDTEAEVAESVLTTPAGPGVPAAGGAGAGDLPAPPRRRHLGHVEVFAAREPGGKQMVVAHGQYSPVSSGGSNEQVIVCPDGTECHSVQALVDIGMASRCAARNDPKCEKCYVSLPNQATNPLFHRASIAACCDPPSLRAAQQRFTTFSELFAHREQCLNP